jgi:hypothetical protein
MRSIFSGCAEEDLDAEGGLVEENSTVFWLGDQRVASWAYGLNVLWIDQATGFGTSFLPSPPSLTATRLKR